jgi:hypothetical protein
MVRRDFSESFQRQLASQRLQLARHEQTWLENSAEPHRPTQVVLNFGCDAQLTPHLMIETVGVLKALDIDFVAVAGPQWCCGQPYVEWGEPAAGRNMTIASSLRMATFQPRETVHWCGAWWPRLDAAFPDRAPIALTHLTTFLARTLVERDGRIPWQKELRANVLLHLRSHHPGMPPGRASVMAAMEAAVPAALGLIPGIRIAGDAPLPSRGLPCELDRDRRSPFSGFGAPQIAAFQDEMFDAARAADARMLVTAHQTCHREWGKFTTDRLPVRHFVSLLADALGRGVPDRYHEYWQLADADAVVTRARAQWESWGLGAGEARRIATALFERPAPAPAILSKRSEG